MCVINVTDCVEFTIHNVSRTDAGPVICAGDRLLPKTAQLYVQENGTVSIIGGNATVTQDHLVEFKCVSTAWYPSPSVSWTLNGQAVDSSLYNTTSMADGDSFNSTSILTFRAVRDTTVECMAAVPALKTPQSSSVFMVVVPTDWTVLIAIVLSFAGFALLVLLILGIIFCYKRRKAKEPNYQDELRRVRTQSQLSVNALGQKQGQVNPSFVGQTNIIPRDSGGFQLDYINIVETSGVANSNLAGNGAVDELGFHKHRHATTV
ncbi:uncharacterized protein igsf5a [Leuresthes tenuis]|uniref:uncharacterized protein igsf5a n=1 Tax=Leuresthes tenuis TaxID=355514 RepID=UPI003B5128E6